MHVSLTFDPLNKYPADADLQEACGLLPIFAMDPEYIHLPLREAMEIQYGFGPLMEMKGGTVTGTYAYLSPGDPPLYPYVIITRGNEVFVEYPYGIVALIDQQTGDTFVTRMD
jgi:hypothetical protein